jgi:glycosyltransferase involved in cell wall biosynthesis
MKNIGVDCFGLTRPHYTGKEVFIHGLIGGMLRKQAHFLITGIYPRGMGRVPEWDPGSKIDLKPTPHYASYTVWCQLILPFAVHAVRPEIMIYTESALPLFHWGVGMRRVVVVYDVMYMHVREEFDSRTRQILHTLMPRTLKNADAVITISQSSKNDLVRFYGADPAKIHIVYPCVADEFCLQSETLQDSTKKKFGIEGRMISYAGNHHRYKNIENLLVAFQHLLSINAINQPTLVLIGKIDKRTTEIETLALGLGIQKKVRITGYVTQLEYESLLSASDLLVLPSLYEGFGIPIIEAMAIGTPVAASNVGAMAEVVGENGVLFNPKDPDDIARSLNMILMDPQLSAILREKGFERVKQFRWGRSAEVMANVLNTLF